MPDHGSAFRLGALCDRPGPDERAALVAAGCTELRIPARWPELQPREGQWDSAAVEALATELGAAADRGLRPWLALLGRRVPGWFDDDGGFADAKTAGRWWPRFVDGLAGRLGDGVAGWFPMVDPAGFGAAAFADREPDVAFQGYRNLLVAWRDAWRILRGGPPVATALAVDPWDGDWPRALRTGEPTPTGLDVDDLAGGCDLLGGIVTAEPTTPADQISERLVRLLAEGPERPLAVLAALRGAGDDERTDAAGVVAAATRAVMGEGGAVEVVFADGILTADGAPSDAAAVLRSS